IQPGEFHSGLSPELEINSIEGGGIGAVYHSGRLIVGEDRFDLRGRIAGAVRERLDGNGTSFVFTRALGEAIYELPPLAGLVRPTRGGRAAPRARRGADLMLESSRFETTEGAAQLLFQPLRELAASAGIGVERRRLYDLEPADPAVALPPAIGDRAQTRPFG